MAPMKIDEMRYILGDPDPLWLIGQVARKTDRWERRVRTEDLCMAEICFENGIRGIYESDLPEPVLRGDVVYGDDGSSVGVKMERLNCSTAKPQAGRLLNLAKVSRINLMRC